MKKILITGITGFVGTNLKEYLSGNFDTEGISRREDAPVITYKDFFEKEIPYDALVHLAGKAHDLKRTADDNEYYEVNFELTKKLYDRFLKSDAKKFIYVSSVKAVKDSVEGILYEEVQADPVTVYGKSKRMAEEYILQHLPLDKEVYILRPCMIHGPGNKGNLNLLYTFVSKGVPYPLAAFENQRSFLSVENLCFVIEQLLIQTVASGIYNVADDQTVSTNEVIKLISESLQKKARLLNLPKSLVTIAARLGTVSGLPLNSERLQKLTENYIVSNQKVVHTIGMPLPLSASEGLLKTFDSFKKVTPIK